MQARKVTCLGLSLIFTILTSRAQERPTPTSARMGPSHGGEINSNYGNAPLMFEANQGQSDSQVKFLSQGNGYSVFLTAGGMILALRPSETTSPQMVPWRRRATTSLRGFLQFVNWRDLQERGSRLFLPSIL